MVVIAAFVVVLGFRVLGFGTGSTWEFAGKAAAPPCRPFLRWIPFGSAWEFAGKAAAPPCRPFLECFWVGMGVRRQSRSPPMPPSSFAARGRRRGSQAGPQPPCAALPLIAQSSKVGTSEVGSSLAGSSEVESS